MKRISKRENPREYWILDAKAFGYYPKAFIKVNDMEREISKLQKNSEKKYDTVHVREIVRGRFIECRGCPTVECTCFTELEAELLEKVK